MEEWMMLDLLTDKGATFNEDRTVLRRECRRRSGAIGIRMTPVSDSPRVG